MGHVWLSQKISRCSGNSEILFSWQTFSLNTKIIACHGFLISKKTNIELHMEIKVFINVTYHAMLVFSFSVGRKLNCLPNSGGCHCRSLGFISQITSSWSIPSHLGFWILDKRQKLKGGSNRLDNGEHAWRWQMEREAMRIVFLKVTSFLIPWSVLFISLVLATDYKFQLLIIFQQILFLLVMITVSFFCL